MKKKLMFIPLVLAAIALLAWIVMLLWNWVMPALFTGTQQIAPLDYWRALGLLVLCRILFGGFRGRGRDHDRKRWLRWQAMTAEEREQFHQSRKGRFCGPARETRHD
jgi:hypothetical protein